MSVLPDGAVVRLADSCSWLDAETLIGGSPSRLFRLSPAARALVAEGAITVRDQASAVLATRLLRAGAGLLDLDTVTQPDRTAVTVVVPVHGRVDPVVRLLDALPRGLAEVIVVDDGSPQPAADALHGAVTSRARHRLLRLETNRGPAAARNAGLAQVRTRFVLFVDSDVVVDGAALDRLLRHFADPELAVVAPRVRELVPASGWLARYEQAASALDMGPVSGVVAPRSAVGWVPSACWLAAVSKLGDGFDECLRVAEDVDLCWRLGVAGAVVRYDADATVRHEHRVRWGEWLERRFRYGTGATPLARRHGALVAPAVLTPWSATFVAALALQRRAALPVAAAALGVGWLGLARRLPGPRRTVRLRQSAMLSGKGALSALDQACALTLRHWWPLSLVACLVSPGARRVVLVAGIADGVRARRSDSVRLDPVRHLVARRLDDVAYGGGVWWSALRGRSVAALLPAITRSSRAPRN